MYLAMNAPIGMPGRPIGPLAATVDAGKDAGQTAAASGQEFSNVFQDARIKQDLRVGTQNSPQGNSSQAQSGQSKDAGGQPSPAAVPLNLPPSAALLAARSTPILSPSKVTVTDTKNDAAPVQSGEKERGEKAHEGKKPKSLTTAAAAVSAAPAVQLTQNAMLVPAPVAVSAPGLALGLPKTSSGPAKGQIVLLKADALREPLPLSGGTSLAANAAPSASPEQKEEAAGPGVDLVPGALKGESSIGGKASTLAPAAAPMPGTGSGPMSTPGLGPSPGPSPGLGHGQASEPGSVAIAATGSEPADPAAAHDAALRQEKAMGAPSVSGAIPPTPASPGQALRAVTAPVPDQAPPAAAPVHELPTSSPRPDAPPSFASAAAVVGSANPHAILDSGGTSPNTARDAVWQFSPNRIEAGFTNAQNSWVSVVAARQDGHLTAALQSSSPADGSALQSLLPQLNAHLADRQVQLDQLGVSVRQQFSSGGGGAGGDRGQGQAQPRFEIRQPSSASVEAALSGAVSAAGRISLRA